MASLSKPARAAPPLPSIVRGKTDSVSKDDEVIYSAPPAHPAPPVCKGLQSRVETRASELPAANSPASKKRTSTRFGEAYKEPNSALFPPLVLPEINTEDEGDGQYMMSGGLQGNDRSERERCGYAPHRSNFRGDFSLDDDEDIGERTTLIDHSATEGATSQKEVGKEKQQGRHSRERVGSAARIEKREKKEIKAKRKHKRTTIGDNGWVVYSESEEEYYESSGPASGCIVGR